MKLYEQYLLNKDLYLGKWNQEYYDSLPPNKQQALTEQKTNMFTVYTKNGDIVGFTGAYIHEGKEFGFFQVYIDKKYRGKNLLCKIAFLVFDKLKLKEMFSTIKKSNIASVKSHSKSKCFERLSKDEEVHLRNIGRLKDNEIRFRYKGE